MRVPTWTQEKAGNELRRLVDDGDGPGVDRLLTALHVDAVAMCTENDLPRIARALGQMQRWQARALAGSDGLLVEQAVRQLRILSAVLDTGWRTASLRAEAEVQARLGRTLRELILEVLAEGPLRPSDLARRLGRDPAQVSRALRKLTISGQVSRSPAAAEDHRAVTYTLAATPVTALVA
jgi:DNA-binding MarR family transcriptional regulator